MHTRLACSNTVHSQFWSCLKWTRVRLTARPVLHGFCSQLQLPLLMMIPAHGSTRPSSPQLNLVTFDHIPAFVVDISLYDQPYWPAISTPSTLVYLVTCHTDSNYTINFLQAILTLTQQWCSIHSSTLNSSLVYDSLNKGLLSLILSSLSVSFV